MTFPTSVILLTITIATTTRTTRVPEQSVHSVVLYGNTSISELTPCSCNGFLWSTSVSLRCWSQKLVLLPELPPSFRCWSQTLFYRHSIALYRNTCIPEHQLCLHSSWQVCSVDTVVLYRSTCVPEHTLCLHNKLVPLTLLFCTGVLAFLSMHSVFIASLVDWATLLFCTGVLAFLSMHSVFITSLFDWATLLFCTGVLVYLSIHSVFITSLFDWATLLLYTGVLVFLS